MKPAFAVLAVASSLLLVCSGSAKDEATLPRQSVEALVEGDSFRGIRDYKRLLLAQEDRIARHFLHQLITES